MRLIDADALVAQWEVETEQTEDFTAKMFIYGAIRDVKHAPTIATQQHWISCSEKLPEYRKLVDVTTRDLRVKLAYLDSIEEDGTDDLWIIPLEDAECALWNVVAWKQRPEPWKGDK